MDVQSPYHDHGMVAAGTYFLSNHSPVEITEDIHDQELMAMINTIRESHHLPEGFPHFLEVISVHQNLTSVMTN
jgi:hypothetical protein